MFTIKEKIVQSKYIHFHHATHFNYIEFRSMMRENTMLFVNMILTKSTDIYKNLD